MIENTKSRDPMLHLLGMMTEGQSDYITGMESAGQQQLVNSDYLPTDAPWERLEELGFQRGEVIENDPLFTTCTLPKGWQRKATDHAMWSKIIDERGIERVEIFYKAAFYDRSAFARLSNPGYSLATSIVYGDGPVGLPEQWSVLTEQERAEFIEALRGEIGREFRSSDNYEKRAREALELIES